MSAATDMRDAYLAAEAALLTGKSHRFGDRWLQREDLAEIRAGRREWERKVSDELAAAAGRRGPLRYAAADFSGQQ